MVPSHDIEAKTFRSIGRDIWTTSLTRPSFSRQTVPITLQANGLRRRRVEGVLIGTAEYLMVNTSTESHLRAVDPFTADWPEASRSEVTSKSTAGVVAAALWRESPVPTSITSSIDVPLDDLSVLARYLGVIDFNSICL